MIENPSIGEQTTIAAVGVRGIAVGNKVCVGGNGLGVKVTVVL